MDLIEFLNKYPDIEAKICEGGQRLIISLKISDAPGRTLNTRVEVFARIMDVEPDTEQQKSRHINLEELMNIINEHIKTAQRYIKLMEKLKFFLKDATRIMISGKAYKMCDIKKLRDTIEIYYEYESNTKYIT